MSQIAPYFIETPAGQSTASTETGPGLEVTLIEALAQLVEQRRLVATMTIASTLLGLLYCLTLPSLYTATTRIITPQQTQSSSAMLMAQLANTGSGALAAAASTGLGLKNPNDLYIGLLGSRTVADAIIQQYQLQSVYKTANMTDTRKALAARTQMTSEKSGFLSLSVTDRDKQRAAQIANAYTGQLRILTKTLAVTEASQRRLFYEDQLKQCKESLVAAELGFREVQENKGLVQLDAQAKAIIEGLAGLRAQIAAKQVEVQALRSFSTENNPDLQLAEGQLNSLQSEQARMEQRSQGRGVAGLGLANVPSAGLEYLRAQHELTYRQALYDMMLKQYDAAGLDEAKDAAVIQVVEPAIAPDRKSSPKRLLILLTFSLVGLVVSCIIVRFIWWKKTLTSSADIVSSLDRLKSAFRSPGPVRE